MTDAPLNERGIDVNWKDGVVLLILFGALLSLTLPRLGDVPAPWFDEGLVLQPAKNLVESGQYGIRLGEDVAWFHPAIQTGPTVVAPIALLFRLFGVGFLQARIVVVVYACAALVAFYALARVVSGRRAVAAVAGFLLISTFDHEFTSFPLMARQVLGEVPALFFFWSGTALWFLARRDGWRAWVGAGLLWGLAMVTKAQFVLLLPVALFGTWISERLTGKRVNVHRFLVPTFVAGLCVAGWYGVQLLSVGWETFGSLGSAGVAHFLNFSLRSGVGALSRLAGSTLLLGGFPAMVYTFGAGLRSDEPEDGRHIFLVVFSFTWLMWYAFFSIGWMRYAFVPAVTSLIPLAYCSLQLWEWSTESVDIRIGWRAVSLGHLAMATLGLMVVLSGTVSLAKTIAREPGSGLDELIVYLNEEVSREALIETWEWEVVCVTDHSFHLPPYEVTNMVTEQIWRRLPRDEDLYEPTAEDPDYLLLGTFGRWTSVYSALLRERRPTLVASFGDYELYRVDQ